MRKDINLKIKGFRLKNANQKLLKMSKDFSILSTLDLPND